MEALLALCGNFTVNVKLLGEVKHTCIDDFCTFPDKGIFDRNETKAFCKLTYLFINFVN